ASAAECDVVKDVRSRSRETRVGWRNRQRPANGTCDWCVAQLVVARLIAKVAGQIDGSRLCPRRDVERDADRKLILEDSQWMALARLIEVLGFREHQFRHTNTVGRC